ncbi:hypothetical protein RN001_007120 [Aquatica leii]|uniref:Uncharacterized protein n=1 Tax=Aquatica leii TaxID=1421715 RepID=A0AAN7PW07_9COLE|nr:hypothetical protein RN001_007120 [Aquatica leii]
MYDYVEVIALEEDIDIILLMELNKNRIRRNNWLYDNRHGPPGPRPPKSWGPPKVCAIEKKIVTKNH